MRSRSLVIALASAALVAVVAACGSAASSPSSSSAAAPSAAAPSSEASLAASEAAPSAAAPSGAAPSQAGPSIALPSLPSEAKDLEAQLPNSLCGQTAQKISMNGSTFLSSTGNEFSAALSALGKSPSDVSVAVAGGGGACSAVAFRIAGVDQNTFQTAILAAVQKAGGTAPTQTSLGGKNVYVVTDASGKKSYVYFKGDTMFIAEAGSDADATAILQALP